jgi:hypothetical protein
LIISCLPRFRFFAGDNGVEAAFAGQFRCVSAAVLMSLIVKKPARRFSSLF